MGRDRPKTEFEDLPFRTALPRPPTWSGRSTGQAVLGGKLPAGTLSVVRQVPSSTITHVSAIPLCHHRRSDFPSPVGDPGCALEAFPYPRKLKRSPAFPPLRYSESCFARQDRESLSLLRVFPFEGPPPGDLGPYPATISRPTCSFLTKRPRPHLTHAQVRLARLPLPGNFHRETYFRAAVIPSTSGSQTR